MTELEQHLLTAFERLSIEFEARLNERDKQILTLSQQVSALTTQIDGLRRQLTLQSTESVRIDTKLREDLAKVLGALSKKLNALAES